MSWVYDVESRVAEGCGGRAEAWIMDPGPDRGVQPSDR